MPGEDNNIPYQYVKAFDQHYIFTGKKVGQWLDLRQGSDAASLTELGTVRLSVAPGIFTSELLVAKPDGSGLFMVGAAVTGGQAQLPMVPADGYAGPVNDPSGLFVIPPDGVKKYATYAEASDYYGLNGIAFVGDNVVKTGVNSQSRDAIALSLFAPDGALLARDAVVYTAAGSTIDDELSGAVAPLGSGSVVTWVENGEVRARLMTCTEIDAKAVGPLGPTRAGSACRRGR